MKDEELKRELEALQYEEYEESGSEDDYPTWELKNYIDDKIAELQEYADQKIKEVMYSVVASFVVSIVVAVIIIKFF